MNSRLLSSGVRGDRVPPNSFTWEYCSPHWDLPFICLVKVPASVRSPQRWRINIWKYCSGETEF